ncbi:TIGR03084 family metal-binding protein [Shimia abyssi]|uniref:Uncharacterized protein (TIGR03084 family) n=1 Tax=Shimia abyssi TaxID=1662395 RepID=A0A2P8F8I6_9RHOB|nr:TIGR03084 family metal-binding protein [Shimia abyssi]PSL18040.1 uncharacterized protein (TIGR03084 family) [Shimia abyssi]
MVLTQAEDFGAESEALYDVVRGLDDAGFRQVTQFKGWTIEDVLLHLHFWNKAVDLSVENVDEFQRRAGGAVTALVEVGTMRNVEDSTISERGEALREAWISQVREMVPRWAAMDPKARLPWVGPSMSARSSMTARQMETWAHGMEVFDILGVSRVEVDRVRNVVMLGVNTFGWSHQVHGLDVPEVMPWLELTAPSGEVWSFGGDGTAGQIIGKAEEFAAVVTQARAVADTGLQVSGVVAETWMAYAQCFAGPPNMPPRPGSRGVKSGKG